MYKFLCEDTNYREWSVLDEASLEEEFAAYLNETKTESISEQDLAFSNNKNEEESSFVDISDDLIKNED